MENWMHSRQFARMPFLRPVHVRAASWKGSTRRFLSGDLSLGGIFIRAAKPPEAGARVEVLFEARGRRLPFACGEVVHRRAGTAAGFGVRFTHLPDRSRSLVLHLMALQAQGSLRGLMQDAALGASLPARKVPAPAWMGAAAALAAVMLGFGSGALVAWMHGTPASGAQCASR